MSIDIEKLAREAEKIADQKTQSPGEFHPNWGDERNKAFAALVLEQAANRADELDCAHRCSVGSEVGKAIRAMKPKDAE